MMTLAASVGVNVSYLSKLERGKLRAPSSQLVKKISKYFRLDKNEEHELILHAEESDRNIKLPENINPKVYVLETVYSAAYVFLDRAYILLDGILRRKS